MGKEPSAARNCASFSPQGQAVKKEMFCGSKEGDDVNHAIKQRVFRRLQYHDRACLPGSTKIECSTNFFCCVSQGQGAPLQKRQFAGKIWSADLGTVWIFVILPASSCPCRLLDIQNRACTALCPLFACHLLVICSKGGPELERLRGCVYNTLETGTFKNWCAHFFICWSFAGNLHGPML